MGLNLKHGDKISVLEFYNRLEEKFNDISEISAEVPKEYTTKREDNLKKIFGI